MPLAKGAILKGLGVGLNSAVGTVWRVAPHASLPTWSKTNNGAAVEAEALRGSIAAVAADLDRLGEKAGGTSAEIFEALKFLL